MDSNKSARLPVSKSSRMSKHCVLVTGGTGYIGSHTVVTLVAAGYNPIIVDNLSNSKASVLQRIRTITKEELPFYKIDLRDSAALDRVFQKHEIASVMHFAGFKSIGESIVEPLRYYDNNIESTISLYFVMAKHGAKKIIFSSSASVYGEASSIPIREDCLTVPTNPYARTKLFIENVLQDLYIADPTWRIILLRYFNPVGAHSSGLIGEDPQGIPNNLLPYISQVAVGRRKQLNIFGNDYPTTDGTGVRDYIHVMDLAEGHIAALKKIDEKDSIRKIQKPMIINLGTGRGYTVMDMLHAFEKVTGKKLPYCITKRRPGDIAACYADISLAQKHLGWKAKRNLADMCADTWRWQSNNPSGYP